MRRFTWLLILFFPVFSFAAVEAGFPSQAIWASKTSAVEGETILLSTVVYNGNVEPLQGTLVFTANDSRIGASEFQLSNGESEIRSMEWKPSAGEYRVAAEIESISAELSQRETPPITVTITEPPSPSALQQTVNQTVTTISTFASSSAPFVVETVQTIYNQTETLRNAGIERIENYLSSQASNTSGNSPVGSIAGTSTTNVAGFDDASTKGKGLLSDIAQTAAAAALFTLKNAALFYPLVAFLILGTLYVIGRRVRRRRD
jgi:hypothetical protein